MNECFLEDIFILSKEGRQGHQVCRISLHEAPKSKRWTKGCSHNTRHACVPSRYRRRAISPNSLPFPRLVPSSQPLTLSLYSRIATAYSYLSNPSKLYTIMENMYSVIKESSSEKVQKLIHIVSLGRRKQFEINFYMGYVTVMIKLKWFNIKRIRNHALIDLLFQLGK